MATKRQIKRLTAREVSELLSRKWGEKISVDRVRGWANSGCRGTRLAHTRVGNRLRFTRKAVDAFVAAIQQERSA